LKKKEGMLNTFMPCLSYLMQSNTDVLSMQSGTTIKAVISYVTKYIAKPTLKTHQIFSSAYDVFEENNDISIYDIKPKDAARKLLMKMVNTLSSKMEIGSLLACL
jgi:hypoxanthine phosphoribosyltransferase